MNYQASGQTFQEESAVRILVSNSDQNESEKRCYWKKLFIFSLTGIMLFAFKGDTILTNLKSSKILTPEEIIAQINEAKAEEARKFKAAETARVLALPSTFVPAIDYPDPCDAVRQECCTDPLFPVLGGVDLVHFRLTGQLQFGNPKYSATVEGVLRKNIFWFADKTNAAVFNADPSPYLPVWGGFECGEFCANGGGLSVLMEKTVDLSKAMEIEKKIAFSDIPVGNPSACLNAFNSFYGSAVNGVFNTRCVSMSNMDMTVPGLVETMPESAVPVKMSLLFGVSPGIPSGAKFKISGTTETISEAVSPSTSESFIATSQSGGASEMPDQSFTSSPPIESSMEQP